MQLSCDCCTEPPGPINNKLISQSKSGVATIIANSDYAQISENMWRLLHGIYGGGPELLLKPAAVQTTHVPRKTDEPTVEAGTESALDN